MINPKSNNSKSSLIRAVKTPLNLYTLIALIVDGSFIASALTMDAGNDRTILIVGSIILLLVIIIFTGFKIVNKGPSNNENKAKLMGEDSQLKGVEKMAYFKIIHLRRKGEEVEPVYRKYISRIKKEIEVFDEYVFFRFVRFSNIKDDLRTSDRSSGYVDLNILHPWQESLIFSDKHAHFDENSIEQKIINPSDSLLTIAHYYNGLQKDNEDVGVGFAEDTAVGRIIIDFSSIPNFNKLIKEMPKGVLRTGDKEEYLGVVELSKGIYSLVKNDLKKNQVLRIDFKIERDSQLN